MARPSLPFVPSYHWQLSPRVPSAPTCSLCAYVFQHHSKSTALDGFPSGARAPELAGALCFLCYRPLWPRASFILSPGDSSDAPPGVFCFCPGAYCDAPGPDLLLIVPDWSCILSPGEYSEAPGDFCAYAATTEPTNRTVASVLIFFMPCLRCAPSTH